MSKKSLKINHNINYREINNYIKLKSLDDRYAIYNYDNYTHVIDFKTGQEQTENILYDYIHDGYKYRIHDSDIYRIKDKSIVHTIYVYMAYHRLFYGNKLIIVGTVLPDVYIFILNLDTFEEYGVLKSNSNGFSIQIGMLICEPKIIGDKLFLYSPNKIISFDLTIHGFQQEYVSHYIIIPGNSLYTISKNIFTFLKDDYYYYIMIGDKQYKLNKVPNSRLVYNEKIILLDNLVYNHEMQLLYKISDQTCNINNRFIITDTVKKFSYSIKYTLLKSVQNNDYFHIWRMLKCS